MRISDNPASLQTAGIKSSRSPHHATRTRYQDHTTGKRPLNQQNGWSFSIRFIFRVLFNPTNKATTSKNSKTLKHYPQRNVTLLFAGRCRFGVES
jgi:hypothetical protein